MPPIRSAPPVRHTSPGRVGAEGILHPVSSAPSPRTRWPGALVGGLLLALPALWPALGCDRPDPVERDERRALASAAEIEGWAAELRRRGELHEAFPDPPGTGPLVRRVFALGFESYRAELRVRGQRLTLGIRGVDRQVGGGGWLAFAEGTLQPGPASPAPARDADPFAGAVARLSWSCLGTKLMSGNDGVARLTFDPDGEGFVALYLGYGEPEVWTKAYARSAPDGRLAPRDSLRGQIPATRTLPPLTPERVYERVVRVRGLDGRALPYAQVQLKGMESTRVSADADGRATLRFYGAWAPRVQVISAAALGWRNGETVVFADEWAATPLPEVAVELERLDLVDHPGYRFQHPSPEADPDDLMACGACHKWHYDQWLGSRHARAGDNGHVAHEHARLLATGSEAPEDCRACHQPVEALEQPEGALEPRGLRSAVSCDLCHKVHAVTDVRESGVAGALRILRPDPHGRSRPGRLHHVFGPVPDSTFAYMGAAWNPVFQASHFCAGCHQGGGLWRSGGPPKLDTFEEWRRWAASVPESAARSCQDCHMPAATTRDVEGRAVDQLAWDALHRHPGAVHEHRFEGSGQVFAARALRVDLTHRREGGRLAVEVSVTNTGAGHRIPTGTWTKHVLVGVWARQAGRWLRQVDGDRAWVVAGPPPEVGLEAGDWRNPGGLVLGLRARGERSAARAQPDLWQRWSPEELVDERLEPGATRTARLSFGLEGDGEPQVVVRVVHRRGALGSGPASAPWTPALYDEPPEVLWSELVR